MLPQDKQLGVPSRDAPQPVHRRAFSALEPLVLPSRPTSEGLIKMAKHLNALRAIEPPVVIQPAPHHRVGEVRQILQTLVVPGGCHPPIADCMADLLGGLGADRRQEADEELSPPVLRSPRLEGIAEEVELDVLVRSPSIIVLAVDDLGLRWMKLKPAIRKSHPDGFQHRPRLFLTPAVDDASSSGEESHPSALTEPDVTLSRRPALTPRPPVSRHAPTGQTTWGPAARCAPASASTRVLGA